MVKKKKLVKLLTCMLSSAMVITALPAATMLVQAEESSEVLIRSMDYKDGPVLTASGMTEASYGFQMPIFNGGENTWGQVASDLGVNVKVNGSWVDIDSVNEFVYNSNWGHWSDSGFNGYWFKLTESTDVQLYSKSNPTITLDYNLILNKPNMSNVSALEAADGDTISANRTGTGFIAFPKAIADGNSYSTDAESLVVYVKSVDDNNYVNIDNNAASGWIYDNNFGVEQYGYWFKVKETGSINVKVALKSNENIYKVYTITYSEAARNNYTLYPNGSTTITANAENGACGLVFPYIGQANNDGLPTSEELDKFVIEFYNGSRWVPFGDSAESNWFYQGNGYVKISSKNQWGYFDDYVYGLWFQPVTEDFRLRVGFPENGQLNGPVNNNYIEYQFIGAPDAYRPEDMPMEDIVVGGAGSNPNAIEGWQLYYNDEFNGTNLDMNSWSYDPGFLLDDSEPGTAGWGNNEKEYYTDSTENIFVRDGSLHLVAKKQPKDFVCTDPAHTVVTGDYASGKIVSKDKVQFTYGRIDFRAKLPAGKGLWPALWLLPNDDSYGTWAASGEIDVMEARGRVTNSTSGTIHYGGKWPNNRYSGADYIFPSGTFDDDYHVYSCVWELDSIKWYVDGHCFSNLPKSVWYSEGSSSDTAPFDKDFYIIMNLAVGGWFDGGIVPDNSFSSAEMLVDYVRVYKEDGTWTKPPVTEPIVTPEPVNRPSIPSEGKGFINNNDGTITFYVYANENEMAPLVFCGFDKTNPVLSELGGHVMNKDSQAAGLYTYTIDAGGSSVSYMFGYTPLGEVGRRDSELVTQHL